MNAKSLQERLDSLETMHRIGRYLTSSLDLDDVLKTVVDAAVDLTGAEEGSLLLLEESTGDLVMRASRNFQEDFTRTFRLPTQNSFISEVLKSGKPLVLDEKDLLKIKTDYLVHALIYVPLFVQGKPVGVLGVDNRQECKSFTEEQVMLMTALSDYAAIAISNANLYLKTDIERQKLETILTQIGEGVLVVDFNGCFVLANRTAQELFNIEAKDLVGKPVGEILHHPDLLDVFQNEKRLYPAQCEITLSDGRVFTAQVTPIPEVGLAVTMQDITHLKELDRIKNEFVSTVSHDLRSPLTAILGYIELIERVGPINDTQREFIHRVQFSVNNITALINDLLDLGRIEAGFDTQKEVVPFSVVIQYAVEGLRSRAGEKKQQLDMEIGASLPSVLGNPVRLRQMVANLVGNAIKYTQVGGRIHIRAEAKEGQIIFRVSDNGPGIPPVDQPHIFDKFFRASNVISESLGTGLGLAIVKSIVDNHQGRVWVDSTLGSGSTFTVVLPVEESE